MEEYFSGSGDDLGDFLEIRGEWNIDGLGAWLVYRDRLPGGYRTYSAQEPLSASGGLFFWRVDARGQMGQGRMRIDQAP